MRWVRYRMDDSIRYGIVAADQVAEVTGSPFTGHRLTGQAYPLDGLELTLPFQPATFYAVGQNYVEHATRYPGNASRATVPLPSKPDVAYRAHSGLIAHNQNVVIPRTSTSLQYEGELVVVIGKGGRRIPRSAAFEHVLGYSIGNDVSERDWQKTDRTPWRAKNSDTFSPMGPWIETQLDLSAAQTLVRVNGTETSRFRTNEMIFGVDTFISAVSEYVTLQPGDMFWMGTEGSSPDLRAGDVVEVEITGLGVLRNPFIAEQTAA
jgi:2-keto-4-pentenoate hydratase/2-oxohepta-3-ene-1,7-dioic acid hydratase in catechol pathway